jgi:hypothetical protein
MLTDVASCANALPGMVAIANTDAISIFCIVVMGFSSPKCVRFGRKLRSAR